MTLDQGSQVESTKFKQPQATELDLKQSVVVIYGVSSCHRAQVTPSTKHLPNATRSPAPGTRQLQGQLDLRYLWQLL